jgi:hypothetical protein
MGGMGGRAGPPFVPLAHRGCPTLAILATVGDVYPPKRFRRESLCSGIPKRLPENEPANAERTRVEQSQIGSPPAEKGGPARQAIKSLAAVTDRPSQ